jgi:DNA modification methylase
MSKIELYNDDSQNIINQLIKPNMIIVTDPPFNINYHYNTYKDNLPEEDYIQALCDILEPLPFVLIHYPETLYKISFNIGQFPEKIISWVYNSNTAKQHRDIAFFGIKPDMSKVRQPYKNPNDKRIKERILRGGTGAKLYDWWNINQVKNVSKEKTKHPCQMPIEVMKRIVGILPEDVTILDPFMGSGTTGVAVLQMNKEQKAQRDFIGIEIDKEYFEIAKERILKEQE